MDTYQGYDIFEPQVKSPEKYNLVNNYNVLGDINTAREVYNTKETDIKFSIDVYQDTHEERVILKDFFVSKKGKLLPFWYLSPTPLGRTLTNATDPILYMKDTSMLYREKYNNIYIYEPITGYKSRVLAIEKGFTSGLGKFEKLLLNDILPEAIIEGSFIYVLSFSRFDMDTLNIQAESYNTSVAQLRIKELQADAKRLGL